MILSELSVTVCVCACMHAYTCVCVCAHVFQRVTTMPACTKQWVQTGFAHTHAYPETIVAVTIATRVRSNRFVLGGVDLASKEELEPQLQTSADSLINYNPLFEPGQFTSLNLIL